MHIEVWTMANASRAKTGADPVPVIVLRGGLSVYLPALQLAWRLERLGCALCLDGDDLVVRPKDLLTETDRHAIRQWLDELKAIARYDADARCVN
jgi:hypothetical protein